MNSFDSKVLNDNTRRSFLIRTSSAFAAPALFGIGRGAWADTIEIGKKIVVKTTYGQLQGVGENGVFTFQGHPLHRAV